VNSYEQPSLHPLADVDQARYRAMLSERKALRLRASELSANWLSPPLKVSHCHLQEREHGFALSKEADYKRSVHFVGSEYEDRFIDEYYPDANADALLFGSGMSALLTCMLMLRSRAGAAFTIVLDRHAYFESMFVAKALFSRDELLVVDLSDRNALERVLAQHSVDVILVEPVRNCFSPRFVDVEAIAAVLNDCASDAILIIDDTATFITPEICGLFDRDRRVYVVHSLSKLHQEGLDVTAAGIVVARNTGPRSSNVLFEMRNRMGTNIGEESAAMLPRPRRERLLSRAAKINGNHLTMLREIADYLPDDVALGSPLRAGSEALPARGPVAPFFTVHSTRWRSSDYLAVEDLVVDACRGAGLIIDVGASFGFTHTRVYYIHSDLEECTPHLRISPGCENTELARAKARLILGCVRDHAERGHCQLHRELR